ncbi:hypothetical protein [Halostagnicola sp. A56]|nr:hypothetical protein [Halostagnicola sp. A56]
MKYAAVWAGAFVLVGPAAETVFDPELTGVALLVALVAATAITYLVSKRL